MNIQGNSLERDLFLTLMRREFGIVIAKDDLEQVVALKQCIHIYDKWQDFYEATGWERDNPELSHPEYLTTNHICREIQGKIWYFSRLNWETEKNEGKLKSNQERKK